MTEDRSSSDVDMIFTKRRNNTLSDSPTDRANDSSSHQNSHPFVIRSESFLSTSEIDLDQDNMPSARENNCSDL